MACSPKTQQRSSDNPDVIDEYENANLDAAAAAVPAGGFTPAGVLDLAGQAGGLTKLPKGVASAIIGNFIQRLTSVPRAKSLLPDLKLIDEELNSGIIDRGEVGGALQRLARGTRQVAGDGSPYNALASALQLSGDELVGN